MVRRIVLTKPLSIGDSEGDYKVPNIARRVLSLFKNVRSGSDLTNFQLPPLFNLPKSQLQCYGESVYCVGKDLLHQCNTAENKLDRFIRVVAWSISTTRPSIFGVAPYNPILGETHHVSNGTLNVLLEQVSHHPPVSALHASDEKENIEMIWCQHPKPKFYGTGVEVEVQGKRELKLMNYGETYVMNSPKLSIKFLPPRIDWVGHVKVHCQQTDLEAELSYLTTSFIGRRGQHCIKGKIYESSTMKTLFEIEGHWNSFVKLKDFTNKEARTIYNAKEVISDLKGPVVKDLKSIWTSESVATWSEVSESILSKNWEKAIDRKKAIEEEQRELVRMRESKGESWIPKHFVALYNENEGWNCLPIKERVPPSPIVVPI